MITLTAAKNMLVLNAQDEQSTRSAANLFEKTLVELSTHGDFSAFFSTQNFIEDILNPTVEALDTIALKDANLIPEVALPWVYRTAFIFQKASSSTFCDDSWDDLDEHLDALGKVLLCLGKVYAIEGKEYLMTEQPESLAIAQKLISTHIDACSGLQRILGDMPVDTEGLVLRSLNRLEDMLYETDPDDPRFFKESAAYMVERAFAVLTDRNKDSRLQRSLENTLQSVSQDPLTETPSAAQPHMAQYN